MSTDTKLLAAQKSADYAWRNARVIDAARMEAEKKLLAAQAENKRLRDALDSIWRAYTVFVSNGGGSWKRHVEEAICDARKTIATPDDTAELDALIADAERYRWLRDVGQEAVEVFFATDNNSSGWGCWDSWADKDAAIDAMKEAKP